MIDENLESKELCRVHCTHIIMIYWAPFLPQARCGAPASMIYYGLEKKIWKQMMIFINKEYVTKKTYIYCILLVDKIKCNLKDCRLRFPTTSPNDWHWPGREFCPPAATQCPSQATARPECSARPSGLASPCHTRWPQPATHHCASLHPANQSSEEQRRTIKKLWVSKISG